MKLGMISKKVQNRTGSFVENVQNRDFLKNFSKNY